VHTHDSLRHALLVFPAKAGIHFGMGTGWSLSSGRPKAGPGGQCDKIFDVSICPPSLMNLVNMSEH
jgi:hypothetical protein